MSPKEVEAWLIEQATKREAELKAKPLIIGEKELARIEALSKCTFLPGGFDKRFVRSMSAKALGDTLTVKQAETLAKLFHRYRRQHGGSVE